MKYITKYKIFESNTNEIVNTLKDISLDVKDLDRNIIFQIRFDEFYVQSYLLNKREQFEAYKDAIIVKIIGVKHRYKDDIIENIERMKKFMSDYEVDFYILVNGDDIKINLNTITNILEEDLYRYHEFFIKLFFYKK